MTFQSLSITDFIISRNIYIILSSATSSEIVSNVFKLLPSLSFIDEIIKGLWSTPSLAITEYDIAISIGKTSETPRAIASTALMFELTPNF